MDTTIAKKKKAQEDIAVLNLFSSKEKQKPTEHKPSKPAKKVGESPVVGKKDHFTVFNNEHADEAARIIKILLEAPTFDDYVSISCDLRDDLNEEMYVYVVSVASSHRHDMKSTRIPPIYQTRKQGFFRSRALKALKASRAKEAGTDVEMKSPPKAEPAAPPAKPAATPAAKPSPTPAAPTPAAPAPAPVSPSTAEPKDKRKKSDPDDQPPAPEVVPAKATYSSKPIEEVEECMDYWREDVCLNSHHWHWHVVYPIGLDYLLDRRGELFFYMHRQMLARYDAERLSNGLNPVKPFDNWDDPIQGYDGELVGYGLRPPNKKIPDDAVAYLKQLKAEGLKKAHEDGWTVDTFGSWVERYLHNPGHGIIASLHEVIPGNQDPIDPGVMNYTQTAIRDPIFFRWHKYVDDMMQCFKDVQKPYTDTELTWPGIEVVEIDLLDKNHFVTNRLETFRRTKEIDLSYSIDLRFIDYDGNSETVTHLDHNKFSYRIHVKNSTGKPQWATVRVFMVPVKDENGQDYSVKDYTTKCIEMDRFTQKIGVGSRIFERSSSESSVVIPWDQSFDVLYGNIERETIADQQADEDYCGCGWPEHLQIPRGTEKGMPFKVIVMLTDWEEDKVNRKNTIPTNPDDMKLFIIADNEEYKSCKNAASYCGRRDLLYPDKRDMGYPFDKPLKKQTLDAWITGKGNINYTDLTIQHTDKIIKE